MRAERKTFFFKFIYLFIMKRDLFREISRICFLLIGNPRRKKKKKKTTILMLFNLIHWLFFLFFLFFSAPLSYPCILVYTEPFFFFSSLLYSCSSDITCFFFPFITSPFYITLRWCHECHIGHDIKKHHPTLKLNFLILKKKKIKFFSINIK